MLRGIYTAASGMIHSQYEQDVTANNIANVDTNGYKQDRVVTEPFEKVMVQNMDKVVFNKPTKQQIGQMTFGVREGVSYTNFVQGSIADTGRDLDFALNGRGFFAVGFPDDADNPVKYTRDGSFSLDSNGRIVNSSGGYLLARNIENGELGFIETNGGKVEVTRDGIVSIDSVPKYSLEIVDFDDYNGVYKSGRNMYVANGATPVELTNGQFEVNQGKLEGSNVDLSTEMVNMITNLRSFQANQRVVQAIDETLGKAVNDLGSLR